MGDSSATKSPKTPNTGNVRIPVLRVKVWPLNTKFVIDNVQWLQTLPINHNKFYIFSCFFSPSLQHSKSPTVSLTYPNSKVDMSRTDINVDKHATSSAPFSPSLTASPSQTCSGPVPPSADLSLVTIEGSQTTIIGSGKKTTSTSHNSSLAPCDQVEQPTKITESHPSTDQKKVCGVFSLSQNQCIIELKIFHVYIFFQSYTKSTYELIVELINDQLVINQTLIKPITQAK